MPDVTDVIINWMDKRNHMREEELIVTRYGLQLVMDSTVKLLLIQILGIALGRGQETFFSLLTFCTLRSQAGGIHARSNIGCTVSMVGICVLSILSSYLPLISIPAMVGITVVFCIMVLLFAPYTINQECFSSAAAKRKKVNALIITFVWLTVGIIIIQYRNIIMCALILEGITLLPVNKIKNSKEATDHEMYIY